MIKRIKRKYVYAWTVLKGSPLRSRELNLNEIVCLLSRATPGYVVVLATDGVFQVLQNALADA